MLVKVYKLNFQTWCNSKSHAGGNLFDDLNEKQKNTKHWKLKRPLSGRGLINFFFSKFWTDERNGLRVKHRSIQIDGSYFVLGSAAYDFLNPYTVRESLPCKDWENRTKYWTASLVFMVHRKTISYGRVLGPPYVCVFAEDPSSLTWDNIVACQRGGVFVAPPCTGMGQIHTMFASGMNLYLGIYIAWAFAAGWCKWGDVWSTCNSKHIKAVIIEFLILSKCRAR